MELGEIVTAKIDFAEINDLYLQTVYSFYEMGGKKVWDNEKIAFVFGRNIDTDQIYPGRYLELIDPKEIAQHCLEGADPNFAKKVKDGDIVVAGTNFGCGSSREHAAITLKTVGVGVVLAESFARIFFRNAINLALPLMVCPGISEKVKDGDELQVNLEDGVVFNKITGEIIQGEKCLIILFIF